MNNEKGINNLSADEKVKETPNSAENIPKNLKPITFIDYYTKNYGFLFVPETQKTNVISPLKKIEKVPLIDFVRKEQLSKRLFSSKSVSQTAIAIRDDDIFAGDSQGVIHKYSLKTEYEFDNYVYKGFSALPSEQKIVKSIYIFNHKTLIAGYSNGFIILWDIASGKPESVFESIHKTGVVCVKGLEYDSKSIEFLSSDLDGTLKRVLYSKGFFSSLSTEPLEEEIARMWENKEEDKKYPIYSIQVIRPTNKIIKIKMRSKVLLIAAATFRYVAIMLLEPYVLCFGLIELPEVSIDILTGLHVSFDCALGEGYYNGGEEETVLFSVSWGRTIRLYSVDFGVKKEGNLKLSFSKPKCHYVNDDYEIIRVGFLSRSTMFIVDTSKKMKLISTYLLPKGDISKEDFNDIIGERYVKSSDEDNCIISEKELEYKDIFAEQFELTSVSTYYSYNNFIISIEKSLYFLSSAHLYYVTIPNYQEYFEHLIEDLNWKEALELSLNIYRGVFLKLPETPINPKEREEVFSDFLKGLAERYVNYGLESQDVDFSINMTLNFCIQCDLVYYLLNDLMVIYRINGYNDKVIKKLEPMIFNEQLKEKRIPNCFISDLFSFYLTNNDLTTLSHLYTHLTYNEENRRTIIDISTKFNMYTTLIFLLEGEKDIEKKITLIEKIQNDLTIKVRKTDKKIESFLYYEFLRNHTPKELEDTVEYLGHFLLWYINELLDKKESPVMVITILIWLVSEKVFVEMLRFDSFNFFQLLSKIFLSEKILTVTSFDFDSAEEKDKTLITESVLKFPLNLIESQKEAFNFSFYQDINKLMNHIISKAESFYSFYIIHDLNMFIIKIAQKFDHVIDSERIGKAINNLLSFPKEIKSENCKEDIKDKFRSHGVVVYGKGKECMNEISKDYINEISKNLTSLICSPFYHSSEEEKEIMEQLANNTDFPLVTIKLLELDKKYIECFDVNVKNIKIVFENDINIFDWIERVLYSLTTENNFEYLERFKKKVISQLSFLVKVSLKETEKMINNWYKDDKKAEILSQLDSVPEFQLNFIDSILKSKKEKMKEKDLVVILNKNEKEKEAEIENEDEDEDDLEKLCLMHLNLLIKFGRKNEVLGWIETFPMLYPFSETLEICGGNGVDEACVYLYLREERHSDALELSTYNLQSKSKEILKDPLNPELKEKFKYWLDKSIEICEKSYDIKLFNENDLQNRNTFYIMQQENEQLWTTLIKKVNELYKDKTQPEAYLKMVSEALETLLAKMCFYITAQNVLNLIEELELEFKEFRKIIMKIILSLTALENVYDSAKKVSSISISEIVCQFKKINESGNLYRLNKCDSCSKKFTHMPNEEILVFRCGHKIHRGCVKLRDEKGDPICITCKKREIESALTINEKDKNLSFLLRGRTHTILGKPSDGTGEFEMSYSSKMERNNRLKKLKEYDKHYYQSYSMLK